MTDFQSPFLVLDLDYYDGALPPDQLCTSEYQKGKSISILKFNSKLSCVNTFPSFLLSFVRSFFLIYLNFHTVV